MVSDSWLSEKVYLESTAVLMLVVVPELLLNCQVMPLGDTGG